MKQCVVCKCVKPYTAFSRCTQSSSGHKPACKICASVRAKRYRRTAKQRESICTPAQKRCGQCGEVKPSADFYRDIACHDGLHNQCKKCLLSAQHKSYMNNPTRPIAARIKRAYGMTVEDYDRILAQQNGRCRICRRPPERTRLCIDHNHESGQVRGLLCSNCNALLGLARESQSILQAAIEYLDTYDSIKCD